MLKGKTSDTNKEKSKHSKKGNSRKLLIESPWNFGLRQPCDLLTHPSLVSNTLADLLKTIGFAEWNNLRRVRFKSFDEATRKRFTETKRSFRCLFAVGFNEVVRNLEKHRLAFVVAPTQLKPPHLLEALALCCVSANVPVVLVDDMEAVSKMIKVSSCVALGVKKPVKPDGEVANASTLEAYSTHLEFVDKLLPQALAIPSDLPQLHSMTEKVKK